MTSRICVSPTLSNVGCWRQQQLKVGAIWNREACIRIRRCWRWHLCARPHRAILDTFASALSAGTASSFGGLWAKTRADQLPGRRLRRTVFFCLFFVFFLPWELDPVLLSQQHQKECISLPLRQVQLYIPSWKADSPGLLCWDCTQRPHCTLLSWPRPFLHLSQEIEDFS